MNAQLADLLKVNHYVLNVFPYWTDELLEQWETSVIELTKKVTKGMDLDSFYQELMKLSGLLNDGHTMVYLPKKIKEKLSYPPMSFTVVDNKLQIDDSEESYQHFISKEIKGINGISNELFLQELLSYG